MKVNADFVLEATPERIYSMLKLIAFNKYTKSEIKMLIQPNNENGTACDSVLNYCKQCEWIILNEEQKYELNLPVEYIKDIQTFRRWINKYLFEGDKNWYYEFTKWYISKDEEILKYNLKEVINIFPQMLENANDKCILYWRLWSSFLGFGNLQKVGNNSRFTPNPYIRIEDILALDEELDRNVSIPFREFVMWLSKNCLELKDCISDHNLSTFLSLALRVMYDHKVIDLEYHQDSTDVWHLTNSRLHEIEGKVTHIVIKGVK